MLKNAFFQSYVVYERDVKQYLYIYRSFQNQ